MQKLLENINNKNGNYVLPFFWQHGEDAETLRTYVDRIQASGCGALCVEARPHPDFAGEGWWKDLKLIVSECKSRGMDVWILDDSHFPTGFANGKIKEEHPELQKRFLKMHVLDFIGPVKDAEAMIRYAAMMPGDEIVSVILAKKLDWEKIDPATIVDLTDRVDAKRKTVSFDLPEGQWSVITMVSTFHGGETQTEGYLNPIDSAATDILLQEVYEKHFEVLGEEFGKTIKGFFSDEPRFGNVHGPDHILGKKEMVIPWRSGLEEELAIRLGKDCGEVRRNLSLLMADGGVSSHEYRYAYMDLVSDLYGENFSRRIGDWCKAHGVEYIGHTIEDNNAHARLGYGAGHFFRAMRGQDMAGIDVVLHQLMPGQDHGKFKSMTGKGWDGEFFHYCLGKLGGSLGDLDPRKNGRVMCEVFGAYGWGEGTKLMKWIVDYMLIRGVNHFVPHAFDPKEYPDRDCPPHFYAHGKNPQFEEFGHLMNYTNRVANLLSGGRHSAPAAILYHGEAEWSGECMLMQKPAAELTRNQIDFDFVPAEYLTGCQISDAGTGSASFRINNSDFKALIVPYAEALPTMLIRRMTDLGNAGVTVYFVDGYPERTSEGCAEEAELLEELKKVTGIVEFSSLVAKLEEKGISEISVENHDPYLRYYRYTQEDGEIWMFSNEHPYSEIHTKITLPAEILGAAKNRLLRYDAFRNLATEIPVEVNGAISIDLCPYESVLILAGKDGAPEVETEKPAAAGEWMTTELPGSCTVSLVRSEAYPVAEETFRLDQLVNLQEIEGKEDFTGVIRYELDVDTKDLPEIAGAKEIGLVLDGVRESARVLVNGQKTGVRICPPYDFDLSGAWKEGVNHLTIEVTTTLFRENYDWLSQWILVDKTGLTGSICLKYRV